MACFISPFALQAGPRFPTANGPRMVAPPTHLVIPREYNAALLFAADCDRQSALLLSAGRIEQSDRLAHLAVEARLRAKGARS